jgi:hypothetical protein
MSHDNFDLRALFMSDIADCELLMRSLTPILGKTEDSNEIFIYMTSILEDFDMYLKQKSRQEITYVCDTMNSYFIPLKTNTAWCNSYELFENTLSKIFGDSKEMLQSDEKTQEPQPHAAYEDYNKKNSKYIWLLCFMRSVFDIFFLKYIYYKKHDYVYRINKGETTWQVFLEAFNKKDCIYMRV